MKHGQPRWRHRLVAIALILVGAALSIQPVVENMYHDWQGLTVVDEYARRMDAAPASVLEAHLQDAEQYNRALTIGALSDPWSDEQEAVSTEHDAYVGELAGFGPLGRIRVPSVGIDLPIFHDATRHSLGLGAGHMYGTSLPVGGAGTHAVIAGHTGATIRTYFNRLNEVGEGALFSIDSLGRTLTYRVDRIAVVSMYDLSQIQPIEDEDLVSLVTCIPGHKGERLLVRGVRVPDTSAVAASGTPGADASRMPAESVFGLQPWMHPRLAVTAAALLLAVGMIIAWVAADMRHPLPSGDTSPESRRPHSTEREDASL